MASARSPHQAFSLHGSGLLRSRHCTDKNTRVREREGGVTIFMDSKKSEVPYVLPFVFEFQRAIMSGIMSCRG